MLTPQALERAAPGFRRGYRDAANGRPRAEIAAGSWEAFDYADGYAAAENDRKWSEKRRDARDDDDHDPNDYRNANAI